MCGIAGLYSTNPNFSSQEVVKMTNTLVHRGPDAEGYFNNCKDDVTIGLGHRRLSILDLSENGNQPMHSHNKRYVMVYNGEVYNYREIANELKSESGNYSIQFNSSSDSEIILEAFVKWGPSFVEKLNGMFSIAIYDKELNSLFIFRDRVGIKPLFYFWDGNSFIFASELKALMSLSSIKKTLSYDAVGLYLHLGSIPAPKTIFNEIFKVEAGSYLIISKNQLTQKKYWSEIDCITEETLENEKTALVKLSDLLMSSVQYQLKSDVPFGVFLSGGIDSSLITAQAVNLTGVKVNTFSIGFKENRYNESDHASKISKLLNTNHHEFLVSYKNALDLFGKYYETYDEPFADTSAIPTMLVSHLAKKHVTVTLSGEGGDELFMGYGAYKWANRLDSFPIKKARNIIYTILNQSKSDRIKRAAMLFNFDDNTSVNAHILSQEQYLFTLKESEEILGRKVNAMQFLDFENEIRSCKRKLNAMEKQSLFDIRFYLQGDLLTKVDRASMKYSLETRVPYLDHRIISFALNLSSNLKIRNGIPKYILKEILYQYIPKEYFDRPKQGFAIPLKEWLKTDLNFLIEEYLNEKLTREIGVFNYNHINDLKVKFNLGSEYLYNRLWSIISFHMWAKHFGYSHP